MKPKLLAVMVILAMVSTLAFAGGKPEGPA